MSSCEDRARCRRDPSRAWTEERTPMLIPRGLLAADRSLRGSMPVAGEVDLLVVGSGVAGELARTREGGHSRSRVVHAGGDATGAELERALTEAVRARGGRDGPSVRTVEHAFLVDLVDDGERVAGALLWRDGGPLLVRAGAVVLASGGAGQLYADTTNPPLSTGDGIAAALRAGAVLADLEFVQFHPTALHLQGDADPPGDHPGGPPEPP